MAVQLTALCDLPLRRRCRGEIVINNHIASQIDHEHIIGVLFQLHSVERLGRVFVREPIRAEHALAFLVQCSQRLVLFMHVHSTQRWRPLRLALELFEDLNKSSYAIKKAEQMDTRSTSSVADLARICFTRSAI